jgi:hypothetical protein
MLVKHLETQPIGPPISVGPAASPVHHWTLTGARIFSRYVHRSSPFQPLGSNFAPARTVNARATPI